jgi:hypothetical protein
VIFGRWSMASTSVPRLVSSSASELPNRPSPMTTTGLLVYSANDDSLLG